MYDAFLNALCALGILFVVIALGLIVYVLIKNLFFNAEDVDPLYEVTDGRAYLLHFRGDGNLDIHISNEYHKLKLSTVLEPRGAELSNDIKDLEDHIKVMIRWGNAEMEVSENEQV